MLAARLREASKDKPNLPAGMTPIRVVIGLIPQQWITYDGPQLESDLRGIPYSLDLQNSHVT